MKRSFPTHEGVFEVPGLPAGATVSRDDRGIPHIQGTTDLDAWYGLGFTHGQDRLFQADLTRRLGKGEVSPWFGERSVKFDRFMKAMDLESRGKAAYAAATPETKALIDAYVDGLNAAAALQLPVEYRLLGADFEPWRPEDCNIVGFMMAWSLAGNLKQELVALELADADAELVDAMLTSNPDTPAFDPFWDDLRKTGPYTLTPEFKAFTTVLGGRVENLEASNAWIVDGSRTQSGLPIVANDPHLAQRVPSLWYTADLHGPSLDVAGGTLPGLPAFPVAHNAHMAWGLTNLMADVVDIAVVEKVDDTSIRLDGKVVPLGMRTVKVALPKGEPDVGTVAVTPIGPVISSLDADHLLVMRWHTLDITDRLIDITSHLATGETVADTLEAVRPLSMSVTQNLLIADDTGDWAWQVVGNVPKRRHHTGRVPYPASTSEHGWDGSLTDLPTLSKADGLPFYVSANHPPDHALKDAISTTYSPMRRHDRIAERLAEMTDVTPEQMHQLHLDVRENGAATFLSDLLDGVNPSTDAATQCHDLLKDWDLEATEDSVGTTAWAALQRALVLDATSTLDAGQQHLLLGVISAGRHPLNGQPERFMDPARVDRALDHACTDLASRFGDDPANWTWGAVHPLKLKHPFAAQSSLLSKWNMPTTPYPGTADTVAAASFSYVSDDFEVTQMPSIRLIHPLADLAASTVSYPGGQVGHPKHPLYRSYWDTWVAEGTVTTGSTGNTVIELRPR